MADVSQVLNALTGVVYQVNSAIHPGAPNPYAPPGPAPGVAPYQMPQDTWSGNRPPAPPTPAAVQTASTGGVMGVLQSLFSAIANFFK